MGVILTGTGDAVDLADLGVLNASTRSIIASSGSGTVILGGETIPLDRVNFPLHIGVDHELTGGTNPAATFQGYNVPAGSQVVLLTFASNDALGFIIGDRVAITGLNFNDTFPVNNVEIVSIDRSGSAAIIGVLLQSNHTFEVTLSAGTGIGILGGGHLTYDLGSGHLIVEQNETEVTSALAGATAVTTGGFVFQLPSTPASLGIGIGSTFTIAALTQIHTVTGFNTLGNRILFEPATTASTAVGAALAFTNGGGVSHADFLVDNGRAAAFVADSAHYGTNVGIDIVSGSGSAIIKNSGVGPDKVVNLNELAYPISLDSTGTIESLNGFVNLLERGMSPGTLTTTNDITTTTSEITIQSGQGKAIVQTVVAGAAIDDIIVRLNEDALPLTITPLSGQTITIDPVGSSVVYLSA